MWSMRLGSRKSGDNKGDFCRTLKQQMPVQHPEGHMRNYKTAETRNSAGRGFWERSEQNPLPRTRHCAGISAELKIELKIGGLLWARRKRNTLDLNR